MENEKKQSGSGLVPYIKITNVQPKMKDKLEEMAGGSNYVTLSPLLKAIIQKAINHYNQTGEILA